MQHSLEWQALGGQALLPFLSLASALVLNLIEQVLGCPSLGRGIIARSLQCWDAELCDSVNK